MLVKSKKKKTYPIRTETKPQKTKKKRGVEIEI